jgi:hypothetical protein
MILIPMNEESFVDGRALAVTLRHRLALKRDIISSFVL